MNKSIAITPATMLRDARLFDGAPVGNDVNDAPEPLACEQATVTPPDDCPVLPVGELAVDAFGPAAPAALHAAKSDDRCGLPKVRAPYVKPEIVSRELTLKRFNPCDL